MRRERRIPRSPSTSVYVALGSNLGDRLAYLRQAVQGLRAHLEIQVAAASPVYETRAHTPRAGKKQPDYLNAVVHLRTTLSPEEGLAYCQELEQQAGRERQSTRRWAPRTLDLDLLVYGDVQHQTRHLTLPHPRMGERRFVLRPLADLAPALHVPPPFDAPVTALLARCPDDDRPTRTAHTLT